MATINKDAVLLPIHSIKDVPEEEYYTSGHRTCQGCESALVMKYLAKAAGPRTLVTGTTGCMYVANTSYNSTPWALPWAHTQLGAAGSSAVGTAAALKAMMRKGKMRDEPINVIAFCSDGGGGDMGLSAISAALQEERYNLCIILYDNESYANTDIQSSGMTPWGAVTAFTPSGTQERITHKRWKKNVPGLLLAGHPNVRYVANATSALGVDLIGKIRTALTVGGPTFIQTHDPCPKGWDFDPRFSHELGVLAVETGITVLWECRDGELQYNGISRQIVSGRRKRKPVREYLLRQGRFAHFQEEDIDFFQSQIDEMWEKWILPGVMPVESSPVAVAKATKPALGDA
ncbi:MAG: thiamine pyrophosphate-dependent enzyme [Sulfobacillus sp.]|nr:thiamine pyrophosphate-dependent enzyme [Sulfobacillus sp.]